MLKPHCGFEILRNEKLFQPIWKQVFPENPNWVETKSISALKGTLHLYHQLKHKQECHRTTEGADDPSGEARAFEHTAEAKQDNGVGLSPFWLWAAVGRLTQVPERGKHLPKAGQTPEHTLEILSKLRHRVHHCSFSLNSKMYRDFTKKNEKLFVLKSQFSKEHWGYFNSSLLNIQDVL